MCCRWSRVEVSPIFLRVESFQKSFHDAGQFYWGKKYTWLKKIFLHTNGIGYQIPNFRVVDIDNLNDWKKAEIVYKGISSKKKIN